MAKYVALDYGLKRIGVAHGDLEIGVALPHTPIIRRPSENLWRAIGEIIAILAPCAVVVGLPLCADGGDSKWTAVVRKFARNLGERFAIPVHLSDEYCTSRQIAEELPAGRSGRRAAVLRRRSGRDDSLAAVLILQDFFNEQPPAINSVKHC